MFPFGDNPLEIFNITIHVSQLKLIQDALRRDADYDEAEHLLIGMIDDAMAARLAGDTESAYGFCY